MTAADLEGLLAADLTDEGIRLILADALADSGRDEEANKCRAGNVFRARDGTVKAHEEATEGERPLLQAQSLLAWDARAQADLRARSRARRVENDSQPKIDPDSLRGF